MFKVNDTCIWYEELKVQRLMFVYCAKKGYLISNNDGNSRRELPSINTYRWQYVDIVHRLINEYINQYVTTISLSAVHFFNRTFRLLSAIPYLASVG